MRSDPDLVMPLSEHLEELRARLIWMVLAVGVGFGVAYNWADLLFVVITEPLRALGAENASFIGTGVAEAFFTKLKVSFVAGIFLASPVLLYQTWRFIAPGLYAHERRYAAGFVTFGTLCFLAGAIFCYEVIFSVGYAFFLGEYAALGVEPALRISEYISFSSRLLLAFGATFELPVLAFFLARVGVITAAQLVAAWRYAIITIFVVAAILTPADVASQLLMAGPLLVLYVISIGVAYLVQPTAQHPEPPAGEESDE